MVLIDYENKQVAFKKTFDKDSGYKISKDSRKPNSSLYISPKVLCKIIQKKKYKITKIGDIWSFHLSEIARRREQ